MSDSHLLADDEHLRDNLDFAVSLSVQWRLHKGVDHDEIRRVVPPMATKAAIREYPDDLILHESVDAYVRRAIEKELEKAA